jgi:predicted dehydrogenase/nucleoside-diphosphate-sugar epimerase
MQRIYITGANGFIGHNLVEYLSKKYKIYALLRKGSLPSFNLKNNITIVYGDLLDKDSLTKSIPQDSVVIHLAANPYDPVLSYKVNVGGTRNLVEASIKRNVKHFINISSQSTKIRKKGVYANTKIESDKIVESSGLNYTILKPSLVYGPGNKGLFSKIKTGLTLIPFVPIFGDGKTLFNPLHVDDLNFLIEKVINDKSAFKKTYDIGSKEKISYNTFYLLTLKYLRKKAKLIHIPAFIGIVMGKLMTKFMKSPIFYVDNVLGSTQEGGCNPKEILSKYNFSPLDIRGGMEKIFKPKGINVAIVGLGKMSLIHTPILKTFKGVNIVALIDPVPVMYPSLKSLGIEANYYPTFNKALKNENINAVFILSPNFTHYDILKTAVSKGIHVFSEKPQTINSDQLNNLKKIKGNLVIRVGYTLLFNRIYLYLKSIIKNKELGNVKSFKATFYHSEVLKEKKGWMFTKKLSGGGVLMNPGPHLFSLINFLFGKPIKVSGNIKSIFSTQVEDEATALLTYKNFNGEINLSWSKKDFNIGKYLFEIKFEKAKVIADKDNIIIKRDGKAQKLTFFDLEPLIKPVLNINPEANGEAYYIEDKLFIDNITNKYKYGLNNLEFALDSESIIFDLYQSSKK